MATKKSGKVTITLDRATVAMLRAKKRDLEAWDELMCRLGRRQYLEIECVFCGTSIETTDENTSPVMLAKENGWTQVAGVSDDNAIKTKEGLGYICHDCWERRTTQSNKGERKQ